MRERGVCEREREGASVCVRERGVCEGEREGASVRERKVCERGTELV